MKYKKESYKDSLSFKNKLGRLCWNIVSAVLFRPLRGRIFNSWRIFLLKCFGAKIGEHCQIYSSCRIWAPWNLIVGDYVAIGPETDIYTVDKVIIGSMITISQRSFICSASHDITEILKPLVHKPIIIKDYSWVAAEAFVGMGVVLNEGAVVGARAVVVKDVPEWSVVVGNPARVVKKRVIDKKMSESK